MPTVRKESTTYDEMGVTNANMTETGVQNMDKGIKSRVAENQATAKKSEDALGDDEPEDNEFLDFSFGM